MEYLVGVGIAGVVAIFASLIGLDRDRAFYPVVLIVIASYYLLFAVMAASATALVAESIPAAAFTVVAVLGFKRSPWFLVVGLLAHGVFDFGHSWVINNPGVPSWWPGFCLAYDFTAAAYLGFALKTRKISNAA